ncbi:bifunctional metallophosphatase/5'-nucleotidase [Alkalinema pantanalense CENA528]|uniref:bifunctional metallophosphatase/5'-nucleotidase n=1 Tax=Alkalinema pantanalense TaxID=1620705 RepID=UPI003D6FE70D
MKGVRVGQQVAIALAVWSMALPAWAEVVKLNLLQFNDVYEITPVQGNQRGGLARLASLRQQLLRENPRTYTILAGDFLSPSALGTAKVEGDRLAGRQMVAVLNTLGLDYATFGNHEFDISEQQFNQRLKESKFQWFSSNVLDRTGISFPNVPKSVVFNVKGNKGSTVRVGLIGLTIASNPVDYVRYQDVLEAARQQVKDLRDRADILVAVTHLSIDQDHQLAEAVPELDLILGGHEHENIQQWRFTQRPARSAQCPLSKTPIFKADANVVTAYIHRLSYDTTSRCLTIASELRDITADLPDDRRTAQVVQQWVTKGFAGFRADGFEPQQVIATTRMALDGRESVVRNQATPLTDLIAQSLLRSTQGTDLAIFNSGSIRIDDVIPAGVMTQYDVIRILPFGGKVLTVNLRGDILQKVLEVGQSNRGNGGYLQMANVQFDAAKQAWLIQGQPLEPQRVYRVATTDFLVSGREQNLGFLKLGEPGIQLVTTGEDVRFALIQALKLLSP